MFRASRKDFPAEELLSKLAESSKTGIFREGDYEVHLKGGRVVGTFYRGFPTPPVWAAAALLLPGEGEFTFTAGVPSEVGEPLSMVSFLLEGALALEEAKALAHPPSLVSLPGRALSGPEELLPLLPLASLSALLPGFKASALFLRTRAFLLERKERVLVLKEAGEV